MSLTTKIIAGATSVLVVLGLLAVPAISTAAEDTITETNDNTGPDSTNRNRTRIRRRDRTSYRNRARVTNRARVRGNTGNNTQNGNTNSGDTETGKVDVDATLDNNLNPPADPGTPDPEEVTTVKATLKNTNTGPGSTNTNRVRIRTSNSHTVRNNARATNSLRVRGNTGRNTQNRNTDGGKIDTGDVTVKFNVTNTLN